ncbi:protein lin-37 homolog [Morus notabilis]|uniref:protein lin-37 homolog n=1 Tax=Morus notabilis TaxID=981085 RepID=UPI000CED10B3|nr:protein lin-37 homolog [Morus notabilis]
MEDSNNNNKSNISHQVISPKPKAVFLNLLHYNLQSKEQTQIIPASFILHQPQQQNASVSLSLKLPPKPQLLQKLRNARSSKRSFLHLPLPPTLPFPPPISTLSAVAKSQSPPRPPSPPPSPAPARESAGRRRLRRRWRWQTHRNLLFRTQRRQCRSGASMDLFGRPSPRGGRRGTLSSHETSCARNAGP